MRYQSTGTEEAEVKAEAIRLGFDAARITTPDPPGHAESMAAYLKAGMHGDMTYLERRAKLRAGPLSAGKLLQGTRSVIMLAVSYDFDVTGQTDASGESIGRAVGTVARYARGHDYHPILWEKLNALRDFIKERWPGTRSRGYADSGPIRERELAARAGIGWQGKHTGLISLDLGNWFFLGAMLTTLPLRPDAPLDSDLCGTCTRCISACPTGALIAPLTLDARRCISYLTIELKGAIPLELRPLIGDRIFGCDDCLAACPWNERARKGREMRLAARGDADAAHPDLLGLLELLADEGAFQARFHDSAMLRPGREGLRRNVCVALGNMGGVDALEALRRVDETDESEMVREHAEWAVGQIVARNQRSLEVPSPAASSSNPIFCETRYNGRPFTSS